MDNRGNPLYMTEPTEPQMDGVTPSNPPFLRRSAPLGFLVFPFRRPTTNTQRFGGFVTPCIGRMGDMGAMENGRTGTTDHRGTPHGALPYPHPDRYQAFRNRRDAWYWSDGGRRKREDRKWGNAEKGGPDGVMPSIWRSLGFRRAPWVSGGFRGCPFCVASRYPFSSPPYPTANQ